MPNFIASRKIFTQYSFWNRSKDVRMCQQEKYNSNSKIRSTHSHNYIYKFYLKQELLDFFLLLAFLYTSYKLFGHGINVYLYNKTLNDFQICILICFFITLWPLQPTMSFFNNG